MPIINDVPAAPPTLMVRRWSPRPRAHSAPVPTPPPAVSIDRPSTVGVIDRMFAAVEQVRERLDRACGALGSARVPYAVVGGNAVAAFDEGAVRNTRDVDILLREEDLPAAEVALSGVGFVRDSVLDVVVFLDGPDGKPSQGLDVLIASRKVREGNAAVAPRWTSTARSTANASSIWNGWSRRS